MITNFKLYESVKNTHDMYSIPEVGDYVICDASNINKNLLNSIGKITNMKNNSSDKMYDVLYDDEKIIGFFEFEILYWSKRKKDLIEFLDTKKYNL